MRLLFLTQLALLGFGYCWVPHVGFTGRAVQAPWCRRRLYAASTAAFGLSGNDFTESSQPLDGFAEADASSSVTAPVASSPAVTSSAPSPPPPQDLKFDNIKNIRDLSTVRNSNIKPGRVYRTGYLSKASEEDMRTIREVMNLKTLIDLRSEKELGMDDMKNASVYVGYESWMWGKGAISATVTVNGERTDRQRHFISVIDESVYQRGVFRRLGKRKKAAALFLMTGGAVSKRARRRARNIFLKYINDAGLPLLNELLLNYSGPALKRVLELLADRSRHPIGLYCTAGKDRTGLVVLLVLAALGVEVPAIQEDYVLSDTAYDDLNDEKALVGALEQNNLDPQKFLRAPGSVIEHTFRYIEAKYGSVDNYLDSIGFTQDKREELRAALTRD